MRQPNDWHEWWPAEDAELLLDRLGELIGIVDPVPRHVDADARTAFASWSRADRFAPAGEAGAAD